MAAYRRVYDSRHLQADCQEPGSAGNPTLGNQVWAGFLMEYCIFVHSVLRLLAAFFVHRLVDSTIS